MSDTIDSVGVIPLSLERPFFRRLSSMTSTEIELKGGSVVTVPERILQDNPKQNDCSIAAAIETARIELNAMNTEEECTLSSALSLKSLSSSPTCQVKISTTDIFAFAFDIDGVLIRGGRPIPEAIEAMKVLNGKNEYGVKVQVSNTPSNLYSTILLTTHLSFESTIATLTNLGGGKTESERCIDLSRQLDIEVSPSQFICGHTPMREMVEKYTTILVVGGEGEKCREVAEEYGFRDVVTPGDIIKYNEATTPFRRLTNEERAKSRKRDFSKTKIEAIFIFADSREWASDIQIILDLAMSKGGYIGTLSEIFNEGPPIYFSHNDIVWSAAHDNVRLGMGALRKMVEMLFTGLTKGKELETIAFGKPQIGTFQFASRLLQQWRKEEYGIDRPPETVYFVGDTPESDIKGTNEYNEKAQNEWHSILVNTGVYQPGTEPAFKPRVNVSTVLDAVNYGIRREMKRKMEKLDNNC
ncbi:hypothetical protein EPUL_005448 [Erysiphe pulchra]|uniref:HAD-superfamily hydrolase n=1 Tax=Erysiphe pulchra TaxID=225359 RepID=A0A2S4PPT4_9PEZI|nr:hypothetical protein EPUL_005448 [Erysiphe pulchra]